MLKIETENGNWNEKIEGNVAQSKMKAIGLSRPVETP